MSNMVFTKGGTGSIFVQYGSDLIDAVTALDSALLQPPQDATHFLRFGSGQNTGLVPGVMLTGQTSAATLRVVSVVITYGTIGTSDAAGILFVKEVSGTVSSGENLRVSASTYCVARSTQVENTVRGMLAKGVVMSVETNSARYTLDGIGPTNSTDTPAGLGHLIVAADYVKIMGVGNLKGLRFRNAVAASNGVVNFSILY